MLGKQQPVLVRSKAQKSCPNQRRLIQGKSGLPIRTFKSERSFTTRVRIEVGQIVVLPRDRTVPMHELNRLASMGCSKADAQSIVSLEDRIERSTQSGGRQCSIHFEHELDEIGVFSRAIVLRMEQQAFLHRCERPNVLYARILLVETFVVFRPQGDEGTDL